MTDKVAGMIEEPRVGVFVCDCGSNIAGTVDCPAVTEYAGDLEAVTFAEEGRWICSVDYLARMQDAIQENDLNRVVVACCTARTHEPLFKKTVKEAGLNPYLLEFVSIREQCSWVHRNDKEKATDKAKDLVKMGTAKARLLEEGEEIRLPVKTECLVVGGGAAGMTSALAVAEQGYHVMLVEREPELGGLLRHVSEIAPEGVSAQELLREMIEKVTAHEGIDVLTGTEIQEVDGYIGNYTIGVSQNGSTEDSGSGGSFGADTIIVATGMREISTEGQHLWGEDPRVVTMVELEDKMRSGELEVEGNAPGNVVFINCVNSRNGERGCCAIGCSVGIKNAAALKEANPGAQVTILYKDLITVKEEYAHLKEVMKEGVRFVRFSEDARPEVVKEEGDLKVKVFDVLLGQELTLPADLVVLATGFQGSETVDTLRGQLKLSGNEDGFLQEAHVKLGPMDFPMAGIYLAGAARNPKPLRDVREEALGAAMRASIPMTNGFIEAEGIVAKMDLAECNSCERCAKNCPFGAIEMVEVEDGEKPKPHVLEALCKGCGLCAAECPKECIQIVHYSDEQILAQVDAALAENPEDKIVAFVCHWCALGAVDIAGVGRAEYPPNVRIIRVMCSARVAQDHVITALDKDAGGVLVAGCEFPTCHYITGNYKCKDRLDRLRKKLERKGYDTDRLWEVWLSAAMGPKWVETQKEMVAALGLES